MLAQVGAAARLVDEWAMLDYPVLHGSWQNLSETWMQDSKLDCPMTKAAGAGFRLKRECKALEAQPAVPAAPPTCHLQEPARAVPAAQGIQAKGQRLQQHLARHLHGEGRRQQQRAVVSCASNYCRAWCAGARHTAGR
jgi:hypothetical protein